MRSFVIFSVLERLYGIDIECVRRILPSQFLTDMPDEEEHIEGMFQYEDQIIKVLSFRKVIGEKSYEEELRSFFPKIKKEHKSWLNTLEESVEKGLSFTKSIDAHKCTLGQWIDSFHPDDPEVAQAMKKLDFHHQNLYRLAAEVLEFSKEDSAAAKKMIEEDVKKSLKKMLKHLERLLDMSNKVAASLQRCLILVGKNDESFGMNIDTVDDIVHVNESELHEVDQTQAIGEFMHVSAILEHNNKLITIVKDIRINKGSK